MRVVFCNFLIIPTYVTVVYNSNEDKTTLHEINLIKMIYTYNHASWSTYLTISPVMSSAEIKFVVQIDHTYAISIFNYNHYKQYANTVQNKTNSGIILYLAVS